MSKTLDLVSKLNPNRVFCKQAQWKPPLTDASSLHVRFHASIHLTMAHQTSGKYIGKNTSQMLTPLCVRFHASVHLKMAHQTSVKYLTMGN